MRRARAAPRSRPASAPGYSAKRLAGRRIDCFDRHALIVLQSLRARSAVNRESPLHAAPAPSAANHRRHHGTWRSRSNTACTASRHAVCIADASTNRSSGVAASPRRSQSAISGAILRQVDVARAARARESPRCRARRTAARRSARTRRSPRAKSSRLSRPAARRAAVPAARTPASPTRRSSPRPSTFAMPKSAMTPATVPIDQHVLRLEIAVDDPDRRAPRPVRSE